MSRAATLSIVFLLRSSIHVSTGSSIYRRTVPNFTTTNKVLQFLQDRLLHWLEALCWMQKVSEGIYAIATLDSITAVSQALD